MLREPMHFKPELFATQSLRKLEIGHDICRVIASAMNSADAASAVKRHISLEKRLLIVGSKRYDLNHFKRLYILGVGKAVLPMAQVVHHLLAHQITAGILITKVGYVHSEESLFEGKIVVRQANHPIPDDRNLAASNEFLPILQNLRNDDLVICLISGGGSSLLIKPAKGISLKDLQDTTRLLLDSGATIDEMNTIRKHLDDYKGGNLARLCSPASVISLILSDVIGDHLDMVSSGPTVADPSTYQDAWSIIEHYRLQAKIPDAVRFHLEKGIRGELPETVKPGDLILDHVQNCLIGNNAQSVHAAIQEANSIGFHTHLLTTTLYGEASQVGKSLAETAKAMLMSSSIALPFCLVAGGETTVTIHGDGKGGRNQELVLGAVKSISGNIRLVIISLGTDGGDGPTDAAGAIATHETYSLGLSMGLDPSEYLQRNDSYHYFKQLGDLILTGPTFTNVNDLVFIFGF
jgi:glycerate 2-kinase